MKRAMHPLINRKVFHLAIFVVSVFIIYLFLIILGPVLPRANRKPYGSVNNQ